MNIYVFLSICLSRLYRSNLIWGFVFGGGATQIFADLMKFDYLAQIILSSKGGESQILETIIYG
jgi:hypothetical protein